MCDRLEHLSGPARTLLADSANELHLHQVSTLEIQLKHASGKLPLEIPPSEFIPKALLKTDIAYHTLSDADIFFLARLPALHRDPFDRLLIAHAITRGLTILTPDPLIHQYPVNSVW